LTAQAAPIYPVESSLANTVRRRASCRGQPVPGGQEHPPVHPGRLLKGAAVAVMFAGDPLADLGDRVVGEPD
jgi:hypothetical protein